MSERSRVKSAAMLQELSNYVIADPMPFVIDLRKSHDMYLATVDGDEIFDWAGYYGAKLIGHNHAGLFEPEYIERLIIAANNKIANPDFLTQECLDYYRALHQVAPQGMRNEKLEVYVVNSGAEAVENMMKYFINLYDAKKRRTGKLPTVRRFIYFDQAFHGRTVYALNITKMSHAPVVTKDFHGLFTENIEIPYPAINYEESPVENEQRCQESLGLLENSLKKHGCEIVGIIVEPLQGAGGQRVASREFFQGVSELAHKYDVYLGFDEVQTAGGTTGTFFALDQFNLPYPPQAVASGKKLGNGVVYMLEPMLDYGVLDSTWGGTLTDMVRVVREFEIVKSEKLIEQVPEKTTKIIEELSILVARYNHLIFNVRGMGLYQGFSARSAKIKGEILDRALQQHGLLLLGAGTESIRLRPPLTVTFADIDHMIAILEQILREIKIV